jgi:SAM-dependent methyltransferase
VKLHAHDNATEYWNRSAYRGPEHPVVRVFAEEKLAALERLRARAGLGPCGATPRAAALALDLGAGPGVFTVPLARRFGRVVAVDVHEQLLARNPATWRARGDAMRLPFADGTFDIVFLGNLLHHLDAPEVCLAECARALKPGGAGALLSVEPNAFHPLMFAFGLAVAEERRLLRYTPRHLRLLAQIAGLDIRTRMSAGQIFQNKTPFWMAKALLPLERRAHFLGGYQLSVMAPA